MTFRYLFLPPRPPFQKKVPKTPVRFVLFVYDVSVEIADRLHRFSQGLIGSAGPAVEGDSLDVTELRQPTMKDKLRMAQQSVPSAVSESVWMGKVLVILGVVVLAYIVRQRWRSGGREVSEKSAV